MPCSDGSHTVVGVTEERGRKEATSYNFLERSAAGAKIESLRLRDLKTRLSVRKKKAHGRTHLRGLAGEREREGTNVSLRGMIHYCAVGMGRQRKSGGDCTPFAHSLCDVAVSLGCAHFVVSSYPVTEYDRNILVAVGLVPVGKRHAMRCLFGFINTLLQFSSRVDFGLPDALRSRWSPRVLTGHE